MNWRSRVRTYFLEKRGVLEKALLAAKFARDNAPTPTESHSDTTRSEQEKLAHALEDEIKVVNGYLKTLEKTEVKYVEHNGMKIVLVPEGMGGGMIDGVRLVSVNSPLGAKLSFPNATNGKP